MKDERPQLCTRRAWCLLELDHEGPCVEVPRYAHPKPDYMPRRKP